ncbi:MAG: PD40 domain-containing protein [Spirochaetes bacterium]|nr:PD40 domain-containing protein [Spirochaetota bacterium]
MKITLHSSSGRTWMTLGAILLIAGTLNSPGSAQQLSDSFSVSAPPKNLGAPVNSERNEFAPAVSRDGSYLVFNSNRGGRYQDLFISYRTDGKWTDPAPLTAVNSPYNDETPFLSADGTILLFSSDRDGSMEMPKDAQGRIRVSYDLYWSKKTDDGFAAPERLPGGVNSVYHEKTPSLSFDGKTLYLSRWSFGNMSDSKLMKAHYRGGVFADPEYLPEPFNTGSQDFALIPAEDLKGFFFSSNRPGGLGNWDLYFIPFSDDKFGTPVNLGDKVNSEESEIYLTRADQRFYICSSRKGGAGLFDIYESFVFKKGSGFETRAIHFDYNEHVIKSESYPYLDALSRFIGENENLRLEIIGHTDLHGSDDYNNKLSLKRAEAVKDYLRGKGIRADRFSILGAGKSRPAVNRTGKGYDELNRRTEFRIIE